jgi:hypothetical protein
MAPGISVAHVGSYSPKPNNVGTAADLVVLIDYFRWAAIVRARSKGFLHVSWGLGARVLALKKISKLELQDYREGESPVV